MLRKGGVCARARVLGGVIARTAFEERALVLLYAGVAIQMPHKSPGLARGIATVLLVTAKGLLLGVRPGDYE